MNSERERSMEDTFSFRASGGISLAERLEEFRQSVAREGISTQQVRDQLTRFLKQAGILELPNDVNGRMGSELRKRVLRFRHGLTVESYANHLLQPPIINL